MKIFKRKAKSNTPSLSSGIDTPSIPTSIDTPYPTHDASATAATGADTPNNTNQDNDDDDDEDDDTDTHRFLDTVTSQCCAIIPSKPMSDRSTVDTNNTNRELQNHDNHDPDVKDEEDEEDDHVLDMNLEEELSKLDIDKDFNLSILGRYSNENNNDTDQTNDNRDNDYDTDSHDNTTLSDDNDAVLVHHHSQKSNHPATDCSNPQVALVQLNRMEVFSILYKPTRNETATLKDLATRFGISSGMTSTSSPQALLLSKLLNVVADREMGYSILLKRGRVLLQDDHERDLLLFTHGFVLAHPESTNPTNPPPSSLLTLFSFTSKSKYDHVYLYNDIGWVKDLWQLDGVKDLYRFSLQTPDQQPPQQPKQQQGRELHLACHSAAEKDEWLAAFEIVLLKNRTVVQQKSMSPEERDARIVGWQHELLQTSLYTAAVTGQAFFSSHHLEKCNTLDEYNGMAPLHYAALHNQVHIIQHLCAECGANVELKDVEGRTPIYYGTLFWSILFVWVCGCGHPAFASSFVRSLLTHVGTQSQVAKLS
jgi:hypothetical protein